MNPCTILLTSLLIILLRTASSSPDPHKDSARILHSSALSSAPSPEVQAKVNADTADPLSSGRTRGHGHQRTLRSRLELLTAHPHLFPSCQVLLHILEGTEAGRGTLQTLLGPLQRLQYLQRTVRQYDLDLEMLGKPPEERLWEPYLAVGLQQSAAAMSSTPQRGQFQAHAMSQTPQSGQHAGGQRSQEQHSQQRQGEQQRHGGLHQEQEQRQEGEQQQQQQQPQQQQGSQLDHKQHGGGTLHELQRSTTTSSLSSPAPLQAAVADAGLAVGAAVAAATTAAEAAEAAAEVVAAAETAAAVARSAGPAANEAVLGDHTAGPTTGEADGHGVKRTSTSGSSRGSSTATNAAAAVEAERGQRRLAGATVASDATAGAHQKSDGPSGMGAAPPHLRLVERVLRGAQDLAEELKTALGERRQAAEQELVSLQPVVEAGVQRLKELLRVAAGRNTTTAATVITSPVPHPGALTVPNTAAAANATVTAPVSAAPSLPAAPLPAATTEQTNNADVTDVTDTTADPDDLELYDLLLVPCALARLDPRHYVSYPPRPLVSLILPYSGRRFRYVLGHIIQPLIACAAGVSLDASDRNGGEPYGGASPSQTLSQAPGQSQQEQPSQRHLLADPGGSKGQFGGRQQMQPDQQQGRQQQQQQRQKQQLPPALEELVGFDEPGEAVDWAAVAAESGGRVVPVFLRPAGAGAAAAPAPATRQEEPVGAGAVPASADRPGLGAGGLAPDDIYTYGASAAGGNGGFSTGGVAGSVNGNGSSSSRGGAAGGGQDPIGPSGGRGVGRTWRAMSDAVHRLAAMAQGEVLVVLRDGDPLPSHFCSWLHLALRAFVAWPQLGALGSGAFLAGVNWSEPQSRRQSLSFWDGAHGLPLQFVTAVMAPAVQTTSATPPRNTNRTLGSSSSPLAVRRKAWQQLGGFHEDLGGAALCGGACGGVDLSTRLWLGGWQVAHMPTSLLAGWVPGTPWVPPPAQSAGGLGPMHDDVEAARDAAAGGSTAASASTRALLDDPVAPAATAAGTTTTAAAGGGGNATDKASGEHLLDVPWCQRGGAGLLQRTDALCARVLQTRYGASPQTASDWDASFGGRRDSGASSGGDGGRDDTSAGLPGDGFGPAGRWLEGSELHGRIAAHVRQLNALRLKPMQKEIQQGV